MTDKILRIGAVCAAVGCSRPTLYRWMAAGIFPRPIKLGPKNIGWRSTEIEQWLNSRERAA